jgi:hypothetical protein
VDGLSAKLLRSVVGLALLPAAFGVAYAGAGFIAANAPELIRSPFTWGFVLMFLPSAAFAARKPLSQTLEHEFGHYTIATLFGNEIIGVQGHRNDTRPKAEKRNGGLTSPNQTRPVTGDALVTLAPYFLPLLTLPLLVVRPFIFPFAQPVIDFLIGTTLIWHFVTVFAEIWEDQPDIRQATLFLAVPVILIVNMLISVVIMVVVLDAWDVLPAFAREAWSATGNAYRTAFRWLAEAIGALRQVLASIL